MSDYLIPASTIRYEQVIKKSRFIAIIAHAPSKEAAQAVIESARQEFSDSRHVCFGFVAGQPGNTTQQEFSDDGEPGGTAGKPILNVLLHSDVGEIVVVVVRYFGGIKLGTGGLVRAYSSSAAEAMKLLPTITRVTYETLTMQIEYALEGNVRRLVEEYRGKISSTEFSELLTLSCEIPLDNAALLQQTIMDISKGSAMFIRQED